jgi:hypothetical protein
MSKLLFDWLQQKLEQFPLMTILLAVALAAAWMTEIHLSTSQTQAAVVELSLEVRADKQMVWQELSSQRQITIELLQNIDRRLSHIEGRLSK